LKKLVFAFLMIFCGCASAVTVNVNGTVVGRAFEGIGAVSAGGNSRLLIDYPEPYRSYVLDFLFEPKFGANFHHLKVEIGSGQNSTSGSEPCHALSASEITNPNSENYELWLMSEAISRNPNTILDCLMWGVPKWTGGYWTQNTANYLTSFIKAAHDGWGLNIDWIGGCINEDGGGANTSWLKYNLRPTLNAAGYSSVKIQSEEGKNDSLPWTLLDECMSDSALNAVVDAVTYHYIEDASKWPSAAQIAWGKPMWDSEQQASGGDWSSAKNAVRTMNRDYIMGRVTKIELWCPIDSAGEGVFLTDTGVMKADTPWSGNYTVRPAIWGVAHYNQFAEPGWKFIDSGCGNLTGNGNYAFLKHPTTGDWSMIIYAESAESITVNLAGGLSTGTIHVWKSTSANQFVQQADIIPTGGSFTINCSADSLYSLTTTTGQQKGNHPNAAASAFPYPYSEDFESYTAGDMPKYFSDMQGMFQVQNCKGGRSGLALQQMVPQIGYGWGTETEYREQMMIVIPGSMSWNDYEISTDVYIEAGEVYAAVRKGHSSWMSTGLYCGYAFVLKKDGDWRLCFDNTQDSTKMLNRGTVPGFDGSKWHNIKLRCIGERIDAYVDGVHVCRVIDSQRFAGNACIGGSSDLNQYDNISVKPVTGCIGWEMVNERPPNASYTGSWWTFNGSWYVFGDCTYSDIAAATATFPFYGRMGQVIGTTRNDCGYMDVYVDNVYKTTIDTYSNPAVYGGVLYQTQELPLGNHTIKIVVTGQKRTASANELVILEAFSSTTNHEIGGNLALSATASASSFYQNDPTWGANKVNDANYTSRWNSYTNSCWLELDFGRQVTFASARLTEYENNRITSYRIQYYDGAWKDACSGTTVGDSKVDAFPAVTGTKARLYIDAATNVPSIYEFEVYAARGDRDLDSDGEIGLSDLAIFCDNWLEQGCNSCCGCDGADLLHDNKIDFQDYAIFAE